MKIKNGTLRNLSTNVTFLQTLSIQSDIKPSITE